MSNLQKKNLLDKEDDDKAKQIDILEQQFNYFREEYLRLGNLDIALPCLSDRVSYLENGIRAYKKKLEKLEKLAKKKP